MRKRVVLTLTLLSLLLGANASVEGAKTDVRKVLQQTQRGDDTPVSTFTGTVWMNGGKFVLRDAPHKIWYQLDDQKSAARFEGKQVMVTGTLDAASNAIHVIAIEEDRVHGASSVIPVNPLIARSVESADGRRPTI